MLLGSWRGPGRPLGDPLEALEELWSDFGGLGVFWGQSCQSRNDDKTFCSGVFDYSRFSIIVRMNSVQSDCTRECKELVNFSSDFGRWNCCYFVVLYVLF